jgi:ATP-dependent DNA helicase 2 subunit 1
VAAQVKAQRTLMKIPWYSDDKMKIGIKMFSGPVEKKKPGFVYTSRETNERVESTTRQYCVDGNTMLRTADIKKATKFGSASKVIFDTKEQTEMKTFGNPGLFLQGFKPAEKLKWQYNVKNSKFIRPDDSVVVGSKVFFAAMLQKCIDKNVVPICRLVSRYNTPPSFVGLLPQAEVLPSAESGNGQPAGFHAITLPFADDMRKLPYDSEAPMIDTEDADHEAMLQAVGKVVSKLKTPGGYVAGKYENFALAKFHKYIEALIFDRDDADVPPDTLQPDMEAMATTVGAEVDAFTALVYPEGYTPGEKAKKPAAKRKAADAEGGGAAKKPKAEVDLGALDFKQLSNSGGLKKCKVPELKAFLSSVGLKATGKKDDLIERIEEHFESGDDAGFAGVVKEEPIAAGDTAADEGAAAAGGGEGHALIVSVLTELATIYTDGGDEGRAKAFRNAAKTMQSYDGAMDKKSLVAADGIGPSSAAVILEVSKTGKSERLEGLKK